MNGKLEELYNNLMWSFDSEPKGFSSKKLTAFVMTLMVVIVHVKWLLLGNLTNIENVLIIDFSFISALMGISTYQSIKQSPATTKATVEQVVDGDNTKTIVTNEQGK